MATDFSIAWRQLDAQFWGVPQRRKRIFLVVDFRGKSAPEILFKPQELQRDFNEGRKNRKILPIIVRPKNNGKFEILSGHNRVNSARIAGLTEVPVIIKKDLSDEEAMLIVTETNLIQRSFADLSYSERAVALSNHLEALKKSNGGQGKRNDILYEIEMLSNDDKISENSTLYHDETKLHSFDKAGKDYGLSKSSVARYIRISKLIPKILERVDIGEIILMSGVFISYLKIENQQLLEEILCESSYKISVKNAEILKAKGSKAILQKQQIIEILKGEKIKKTKKKPKSVIKLKSKVFSKFFEDDQSQEEVNQIIEKALELYFSNKKA